MGLGKELSANLGTKDSFTGNYTIDLTRKRPEREIFGPYDQLMVNPMRNNAGFIPTSGFQVRESSLCGTCHTLYTPTVDAFGDVVGEFPEQMTYLEWEHSGLDQTCQYCHIPEAPGPVTISNRPWNLAPRTPFGQHYFVGGNRFMIDVLKNNSTELGITADLVHLDDTVARTTDQLQDKTGALAVASSIEDGRLEVDVSVFNFAGHKFPSGFPSRRTWLHISVANGLGEIVFESGRPLADGRIDGNDADLDNALFEPHYDRIDDVSQVQIYEAVMLDTEDEVTWTLLRAASYGKDNRLLPLGFDKITASQDFSVKGNAQTDDDFTGGQDEVTYEVDIQDEVAPFTIAIDFLFQSVSYPFAANLSSENSALVKRFAGFYEAADKMPVVLESVRMISQ